MSFGNHLMQIEALSKKNKMQKGLKVYKIRATRRGSNHENSTQGYTMSTHGHYHKSGTMSVGNHLMQIEALSKKDKMQKVQKCVESVQHVAAQIMKIVHRGIQ